jgi:pimeloyl-ACP methyl ester carboxylesterase
MVGCMEAHDAVEDGTLLLGDGRRLGYALYGRPDGEPLFYFHGHPGSRLEARFAHQAAAEAGLRVIALDRPGYGLSDFRPGRAMTDWPADVAEAANLLQIGRFSVAGASGGGPYALACAWRLPGRVVRAAVISGVGPYQVPGITRGMRWQNRIGFKWGSRWPAVGRAIMRSMHRNMARRPERTIEAIARAMSPVDAAVVRRPDVRDVLIADITEAFRQGSQGAALDVVLLGRPWGFSLREIQPEVHLWQGEADTLVPAAMGTYQAAQIPHCHATLLPGEGHLLIIDRMPELAAALHPTAPPRLSGAPVMERAGGSRLRGGSRALEPHRRRCSPRAGPCWLWAGRR